MTHRDLQLVARDKGRPRDLGKDVEQSSVCSENGAMEGVGPVVTGDKITGRVAGVAKVALTVGAAN